jgi:hypothetical protein
LEKENNADENQKPTKKSQTEKKIEIKPVFKPEKIDEIFDIEIKPVFKSEKIDKIFDILKNHFPNEQHKELKNVLTSGNKPKEKLLFLGNGKTLLDFFKQLLQGQFLTIPVQRDLEKWISDGFEYWHRGKQTKFTTKYASKIISGNERASKGNRLINVDNNNNGELEIIQLKLKNREQN